jgi:hypothetical protein
VRNRVQNARRCGTLRAMSIPAFSMLRLHLAAAVLLAGACTPLQRDAAPFEPEVTVSVTDLTPRFIRFHDAALAEGAGPERRWMLWKEHYDFAALPPVPERDAMARRMLEEAWPRYPGVMDRVRAGAASLEPSPEPLLRQVSELLENDQPVRMQLLVYVGALEKNAFFAMTRDGPMVAIPVEEDPQWRALTLAHEFTHVVHNRLAGLTGGWERSIAQTILTEGLAMRATEALFPGRPPNAYVEHREGWLDEATARRGEILKGLRPHLRAEDSESVMRFTLGEGSTGLDREAYFAGWLVVGHLLELGRTLPELARVPAAAMPELVDAALAALLERS